MQLKVIGSSSKGNCYILENDTSALVIEAGVVFNELKKAIDFNISKIEACLVSHAHGDHSNYMSEYLKAGINVASTIETFKNNSHFAVPIVHNVKYKFGEFTVKPFKLKHDVPCFGYIIQHEEMGNLVFITDTHYTKYKFPNVNHFLIECNYDQNILDEHILNGRLPSVVRNRVMESHISLQTCKKLLQANDLSKVLNIVLLHLSDGNSHAENFINEIQELTGKRTFVADKGLVIDLNKDEF